MNKENTNLKKAIVKTTEKSLMTVADLFAVLPCIGPWYEVKVPQKIQK